MRRKLPNGRWEECGPGPFYPIGQPYPPSHVLEARAPAATGRPRALTESIRSRARRIVAAPSAPRRRQVAIAVLEHASVTTAAEALGMPPHRIYEVLRGTR